MVWAAVMGTLKFLSLHTVEYGMGSCYGYIAFPFLAHFHISNLAELVKG